MMLATLARHLHDIVTHPILQISGYPIIKPHIFSPILRTISSVYFTSQAITQKPPP